MDEVSYAIHLYVPIDFIFYLIVFFLVLTMYLVYDLYNNNNNLKKNNSSNAVGQSS